jgi:hypothetical protein
MVDDRREPAGKDDVLFGTAFRPSTTTKICFTHDNYGK